MLACRKRAAYSSPARPESKSSYLPDSEVKSWRTFAMALAAAAASPRRSAASAETHSTVDSGREGMTLSFARTHEVSWGANA